MKKISSIILVILVLVGCNQATESRKVPHAEGKVFLEDNAYTMILGEYEWIEDNLEQRKINIVSVEEIAEAFDTLDVTKGSKLRIEIGENPRTISVNQWDGDTSVNVELINNEIPLPSIAGHYIYEVIAEWDKGRITYVFDVNVS